MIPPTRIAALNDRPVCPREYVLYWMQASQRTRFNYALEHAVARANALRLPRSVETSTSATQNARSGR